jgi:hypothetical protein
VDSTTTNIFAPNGGEKEIVHVDTLPVAPNIEDKIYEVITTATKRATMILPTRCDEIGPYLSQHEDEFMYVMYPYEIEIPYMMLGWTTTKVADENYPLANGQRAWSLTAQGCANAGTVYPTKYVLEYGSTPEEHYLDLSSGDSITFEAEVSATKYYLGNATNQTLLELKNGVGKVTVTPTLQSGTKIAEIDVDGNSVDLFAPEGGGSASSENPSIALKPTVIFSFDEAYEYDSRFTILEENGFHGDFSIRASDSATSWGVWRSLIDAGHDWSIYSGNVGQTKPANDASVDAWYDYIKSGLDIAETHGMYSPLFYSASGQMCTGNQKIAADKCGLKYIRAVIYDINNTLTPDTSWIYWSKNSFSNQFKTFIYPISINTGVSSVKTDIDNAIAGGYSICLFSHRYATDNYTEAEYREVVEYVKTKVDAGVLDCLTAREYYDKYRHEYDFQQNLIKEFPLSSLSDTSISSPSSGQVLKYNGTKWVNGEGGSGGATSLSGLSDVELDQTVNDLDVLRYDALAGKWINCVPSGVMEIVNTVVTEYELKGNRFCFFTKPLKEIDITFSPSSGTLVFAEEYHFVFTSGETPTELLLDGDINMPDDFAIEANKAYEISIMNGLLLYSSWTMPEQEESEPEQN